MWCHVMHLCGDRRVDSLAEEDQDPDADGPEEVGGHSDFDAMQQDLVDVVALELGIDISEKL